MDLGDRMKDHENRFRNHLPRRGYFILRLDGKAFHTYTKGFERPFDIMFIKSMDETAKYLCENIMGAKFGYVQSDEINILFTDFDNLNTETWFKGNIQKIVSVSAAMATSKFMQIRTKLLDNRLVAFDARVFFLADPLEVENVFIWRQQDAVRNSIQLMGQSLYSHKEMMNKNTATIQDMAHDKGVNWNDFPIGQRRGRFIKKINYEIKDPNGNPCQRNRWDIVDPPIFTQDRGFMRDLIPKLGVIDE